MISVVSIDPVRSQTGVLLLTLSDGREIIIGKKRLSESSIEVGYILSEFEWERLRAQDEESRCRASALRLIERQPRTEKELSLALRRKKFQASAIELIIQECRRAGLVNDEAYSHLYTEQRHHRRYGSRRISQELKQRGVSRDLASSAAARLDEAEERIAAEELFEKWNRRTRPEDPQKRAKAAADFLLRRGFPHGIVMGIIRRYSKGRVEIDD